jgi:hypothetical protein
MEKGITRARIKEKAATGRSLIKLIKRSQRKNKLISHSHILELTILMTSKRSTELRHRVTISND